jgi:putative membrane protein
MKQLHADKCGWSSKQLRALNEAPTLLLVVIVMLAVFKNNLPTDLTAWVIFGLIILMAATIQLYARKRRLDREKEMTQVPQQ